MQQQDIPELPADVLSPLGQELVTIDAATAYQRLVVSDAVRPEVAERLQALEPGQLLPKPVRDEFEARALLAGLWLWHDGLERAHRIAQDLPTISGSFWHAIMHRREGDFDNSCYWYDRCRSHPVLQAMAPRAADLVNPMPADKALLRLVRDGWDPAAFVEMVRQVHERPDDPRALLAVRLQQMEWRLLFQHCARGAV